MEENKSNIEPVRNQNHDSGEKVQNVYYEDLKLFLKVIIAIANFLLDRKNSFIKIGVPAAVIFSLILIMIPNSYTAKTAFIPPPPTTLMNYSNEITSLTEGIPAIPNFSNMLGMSSPNIIYTGLLTGRVISEGIIKKFNLQERYNLLFMDDAVEYLKANLLLVIEENGMIFIKITETDPKLAADIANEYVKQLSLLINEINVNNAKNQKEFLEKRLQNIEEQLKKATERLVSFQIKNKMILAEKQGEALVAEIAQLRSKIIMSETEMESLKTIYTANSPKIRALEAELADLRAKLKNITGKTEKKSETISFLDIPSKSVDFATLNRELKILEQVFEILTKEYELTKIKEAKETISLKVTETARIPTKKTAPSRTITLIIIMSVIMTIILLTEILKYLLEVIKNKDPEMFNKITDLKIKGKKSIIFWKK